MLSVHAACGAPAALLAAALLALASPATATPVTVTDLVDGDPFGGSATEGVKFKHENRKPVTASAGRFALQGDGGFGVFHAFCVDVETALRVTGSGSPYTATDLPFGAGVSDAFDRLFTSGYGRIDPDQGHLTAGFQIAVWEVVYDTVDGRAYDLKKGDFKVLNASKEARGFAEELLAGLDKAGTGGYRLTFLQSEFRGSSQISQNLITASPAAIPLPATAWMLVAGLIALAATGGFRQGLRRSSAASA